MLDSNSTLIVIAVGRRLTLWSNGLSYPCVVEHVGTREFRCKIGQNERGRLYPGGNRFSLKTGRPIGGHFDGAFTEVNG
jgi:hypothetical protein